MFTGLLNNTLTLQTVARTDDGVGGYSEAWTDAGSFRARVSPLSSAERLAQDKTTQLTSHRIYCDPMVVTTKDRIKWEFSTGEYAYFEIVGITNPSETYHHLEIDANEIFGGT